MQIAAEIMPVAIPVSADPVFSITVPEMNRNATVAEKLSVNSSFNHSAIALCFSRPSTEVSQTLKWIHDLGVFGEVAKNSDPYSDRQVFYVHVSSVCPGICAADIAPAAISLPIRLHDFSGVRKKDVPEKTPLLWRHRILLTRSDFNTTNI